MSNNIFSNIMIISDFDGTLRGSEGFIPNNNIQSIKRFVELGGTFIVASGRAGFVLDVVDPKIRELVNAPCVYSNGSYMFDYSTNQRTNEKYVNESIVKSIIDLSKRIDNNVGIRIVRGEEYLTPEVNEIIQMQINNGYMENVRVYTYDNIPVDNINKITVCSDEKTILVIKKSIEEAYNEYVDIFLSWPTLIDIQPKNVSKATAVEFIREEHKKKGISKKIYAVGDYENDIDMLKAADYACCPSNSLKKVLDYCDIHLCSNDEGCIADLINKIENNLA